MDVCAELTLRIIRLAQETESLSRTWVEWVIFPDGRYASWAGTRDVLAATPKPVMIAALLEPGWIAMWPLADMSAADRAHAGAELENQRDYFDKKLRILGLGNDDRMTLTTLAGELTVSVADFRRWTSEYALSVGLSIDKSKVAGVGRITVRPPGGGRPIGIEP
jgi:hypothetical protein